MGFIPANYEKINMAAGHYMPSQVKPYNNMQYDLWRRALYERAVSTIIIELPEIWKRHHDLFTWSLFIQGFVGMGELPEVGKWFNPGTISGYNFYYEPTEFILTNPALTTNSGKHLIIGKDCELLRINPWYDGILDIINYYAEKLASLDVAINTAIINSKFAYVMGAKNKAAGEVLKKIFDKVNSGEPAVFFDSKLANDPNDKEEPWQALFRDVKNNYIVADLLRDFQTVINDFDTEVGIPTLPYEKKERLVTDEAKSKSIDATSRSIIWYDELKRTALICNNFMGFDSDDDIKISLRYSNEEGGITDGKEQDNTDRLY